jgi:hypothetical protein
MMKSVSFQWCPVNNLSISDADMTLVDGILTLPYCYRMPLESTTTSVAAARTELQPDNSEWRIWSNLLVIVQMNIEILDTGLMAKASTRMPGSIATICYSIKARALGSGLLETGHNCKFQYQVELHSLIISRLDCNEQTTYKQQVSLLRPEIALFIGNGTRVEQ